MINIENIKKDCPKSISKYKAYIKVKIVEAQKDVVKEGLMEEKDFEEVSDGLLEDIVNNILPVNPRVLYEFFDDQGVKIFIGQSTEDEGLFTYYNSVEKLSKIAFNRIEAEELAFTNAFYTLEKQLP